MPIVLTIGISKNFTFLFLSTTEGDLQKFHIFASIYNKLTILLTKLIKLKKRDVKTRESINLYEINPLRTNASKYSLLRSGKKLKIIT